ncbi:uncharacterized protein DUF3263 [Frigoribacterium sp. PhB107]|uniref:DUF3263 domain-containing protein n=1 Tax=Frigoribacterium sp. PhB107 TaxID=2485172 RepID=UPI000F48C2EE|nr:DUF3263 domain-containing protein [Frigoribacterium sp. PhB107]ROP78343.1 uncharacterized protein DUF3263 [Frigoribacterium sp. PhB107]
MTDDDRDLLRFEDDHPRWDGAKELAVRRQFELTPVRYTQRLLRLVRTPEGVAAFPMLAHRLERQQARAAERRRLRTA